MVGDIGGNGIDAHCRRHGIGHARAVHVTGCSLLGLYGPPVLGPPSDTAGAPTPFTLYNTSGQRAGTLVPQAGAPTTFTLYNTSGARVGTVVPSAGGAVRGR